MKNWDKYDYIICGALILGTLLWLVGITFLIKFT